MSTNHILIVDDEPNVAFFLSRALERSNQNYRVTTAHSGEEALEILSGAPVDVLVTDLRMPGISGLELIRWARASNPHTRSILITAYGSDEIEHKANSLKASRYITKPFDINQLTSAVQDALHMTVSEQTLAKEQRVRDLMISLIFHHLRVPLTHILGNAYVIADQSDESHLDLIQKVTSSALQMRDALDDFTLLVEWNLGQVRGYMQQVNLHQALETVVAQLASYALDRQQTLHVAPAHKPIIITADMLVLGVLLTAVTSYAIKQVAREGELKISAIAGQGEATVLVEGYPLENGPDGKSSVSLTVVQELVRAMRGAMTSTRSPEEGVSFRLVLPITLATEEET